MVFEINGPDEPVDRQSGFPVADEVAPSTEVTRFVTDEDMRIGGADLADRTYYPERSVDKPYVELELDGGLYDEPADEARVGQEAGPSAEVMRALNDAVRQTVAAHAEAPETESAAEFMTYERKITEDDIPAATKAILGTIPLHGQTAAISYALRLQASTATSAMAQTMTSILRREDIPDQAKVRTWQVYTRTIDYDGDEMVSYRDVEGFERPYADAEDQPQDSLGEPIPSEDGWPIGYFEARPQTEEVEALRNLFPGTREVELHPADIRDLHETIVEAMAPFADEAVSSDDYDQIYERDIPESAVPVDAKALLDGIPVHADTEIVTYGARLLVGSGEDAGEQEAAVHFLRREDNPSAGIMREQSIWYQTIYTGYATDIYICRRSVASFVRRHADLAAKGPLDYDAGVALENPLPEWETQTPSREELERLRGAFV